MPDPITIARLTEVPDWSRCSGELDPIFFDASATRSFADDAARAAFRERWLGRYLVHFAGLAHVAVDERGAMFGYIVGAHGDPAQDPLFADIGYLAELATSTARYPAHLHINLGPETRNKGVGTRLIEAFMADARAAGVPGVHLVTGRASRNRSFYARNGFTCAAELVWGGTPIVMLARKL